jgi:sugar phosphate isomerase/epimerase
VETRALAIAGHWKDARESGQRLITEARALGQEPTIARALRWSAFAIYSQARTAEERQRAEGYLREAIPLAAEAGADLLVARTASYLFNILAHAQRRNLEADAMLPHVQALVIRAGNRPSIVWSCCSDKRASWSGWAPTCPSTYREPDIST